MNHIDERTGKPKIILDLCGGTGAWSRPYKEAGYDVRLITLPEYDVTKVEYGRTELSASDIWFMGSKHSMVIDARDVYGILAAPPCTEFSLAKGAYPRDLHAGMAVVEACLRVIWHCRLADSLKFWALENPRGFLRQFLGKPPWVFEQWQFGGDKRKATDLWGYYTVPTPIIKEFPLKDYTQRNPCGSSNGRAWGKRTYPPEYAEYILGFKGYDAQRAAARAITPPGFAQAFFKANR